MAVAPRLVFIRFEATLRIGLEVHSPSLLHKPFVQNQLFAFNPADADAPYFGIDRIRPLVIAADCALAYESGQVVARLDPAFPLSTLFIDAHLIQLWSINSIKSIGIVAQSECVSLFNDRIGRPTRANTSKTRIVINARMIFALRMNNGGSAMRPGFSALLDRIEGMLPNLAA